MPNLIEDYVQSLHKHIGQEHYVEKSEPPNFPEVLAEIERGFPLRK